MQKHAIVNILYSLPCSVPNLTVDNVDITAQHSKSIYIYTQSLNQYIYTSTKMRYWLRDLTLFQCRGNHDRWGLIPCSIVAGTTSSGSSGESCSRTERKGGEKLNNKGVFGQKAKQGDCVFGWCKLKWIWVQRWVVWCHHSYMLTTKCSKNWVT